MSFSSASLRTLVASLSEALAVEDLMAKALDRQFQESEIPKSAVSTMTTPRFLRRRSFVWSST